jgi:nitrogen fixation/metabolism regulation signal transduction histidine kinase
MKIQHKFILFIAIVHMLPVLLTVYLFRDNTYLFIACECIILLTLILSVRFYKAYFRPLDLITSGIESIKNKDFSIKFVKVGHYEMDMLTDVYNQMIDQLREERVQQTEKHFLLTHLITASPAGILILDVENRISLANPAAATILQTDLSQLAGSKMAELGSYLSLQLEAIKAGESKIIQVHGMQIYRAYKAKFVDRGFVNHFIVIEELTGEIREIERKSYEKVIRMMSHEINNSTGAVNSLLDLVLSYQQQLSTVDQEDYKQAIQVAIERNRHLNQFMTNFAKVVRVPPPVKERYNVHTLLQTIYTLLFANLKKHSIAWEWQLASEPLMIEMDVQQMEQVLLNVVKNAIEAIGEKGTITARTCRKPMQLVISDTGNGITQESKKLLFSPFFSTKKTGQGIGLTLTREILSNHGFDFSLETRHQQTYFTINFDGKTPVSAHSLSALQAKAKE